MALEPREVIAEDSNPELADMTRRLWIKRRARRAHARADGLGISTFHAHATPVHGKSVGLDRGLLSQTPVVLWCGLPFFVRGWQSVVLRSLNMFTLIALGTGSAYLYSVFATVVPQIFPAFVS